jgi:L-threonylcarbamoyladenylate synthase
MTVPNDSIQYAADLLKAGKLVAFPTETVYGLGADARNANAVAAIYAAKGRPSNNPLIVHVYSVEQFTLYADLSQSWNPTVVREWISKLTPIWPGPLSVILPRGAAIAENVAGGGSSVALRIPNHPVALELLKAFNGPVAAPSANPSTYVSPTTAQHVRDNLGDRVDYILDGGSCAVGLESTVLSLLQERPRILRPGAITIEDLQRALGCTIDGPSDPTPKEQSVLQSPGLLAKHYSPRTKIALRTDIPKDTALPPRVGALVFSSWKPEFPTVKTVTLSSCGDFEEIAARLFSALRELDEEHLDLIVSDVCKPEGLGEAIMDRLNRASHQDS